MSTESRKPALHTHVKVAIWLGLVLVGNMFDRLWLGKLVEPSACSYLYSLRANRDQSTPVRVVDISQLYKLYANDQTEGYVPSAPLIAFLQTAMGLDDEHRPTAIAFDLPIVHESSGSDGRLFDVHPEQEAFVKAVLNLKKGPTESRKMPIVIGATAIEIPVEKLEAEYPTIQESLGTIYNFQELATAPLWLSTRDEGKPLSSLGVAAAVAFSKRASQQGVAISPAFNAAYRVAPPAEWPIEYRTGNSMYVDYAVLRHRERFTSRYAAGLGSRIETLTEEKAFDPADLAKLKHRPDDPTLWFVGVAGEAGDAMAYNDKDGSAPEAKTIRRIYQHAAVAHTYLRSPLKPVGFVGSTLLDLAISFLGLMLGLLVGRGFRFPSSDFPLNQTRWQCRLQTAVRWMPRWIRGPSVAIGHLLGCLPVLLPLGLLRVLRWIAPSKRGRELKLQDHAEFLHAGAWLVVLAIPFACTARLALSYDFLWFGFFGTLSYLALDPLLGKIAEFSVCTFQREEDLK